VLLRINVLLVTASRGVAQGLEIDRTLVEESAARYVLSYLLTSFFDLNYSRLPVARPEDAQAMSIATNITRIQVEFMLAHEYAHVLVEPPQSASLRDIERRCDDFAFESMQQSEPDESLRWVALRWLFHIVAIERILGEVLYFGGSPWDHRIDWRQKETRERERVDEVISTGIDPMRLFSVEEFFGSSLLTTTRMHLHGLGADGAHKLIRTIREDLRLPSSEEFETLTLRALWESTQVRQDIQEKT
jgi:hypothetical protein